MKRTRPPHSQLLELLADAALQLGTCRLVLTTGPRCLAALAEVGATRSLVVIGYEHEAPYVIDIAELVIANLAIEARGPARPARPDEVAALESKQAFHHLGTYKAVVLPSGQRSNASRLPSNKE